MIAEPSSPSGVRYAAPNPRRALDRSGRLCKTSPLGKKGGSQKGKGKSKNKNKVKITLCLTSTGILMEGDLTTLRFFFAENRVDERYFSTIKPDFRPTLRIRVYNLQAMRLSWSTALALSLVIACLQKSGSSGYTASAQSLAEGSYDRHRQAAIQINDLAGRIHSEADASTYVSAIAVLFANDLPPAWTQHDIFQRLAHAEFDSIGKPPKLIPEQRIAGVWNQYVREIGAPDEALVNAAEIHNMRDGTLTAAQMMWSRGHQNIWTMPNAFAVTSEERVADGCRAVEAVRILHDLEQLFQNLSGARERLRKGIVPSEELEWRSAVVNSRPAQTTSLIVAHADTNPVRAAEQRYVQDHGSQVYQQLLTRLFNELFPPE